MTTIWIVDEHDYDDYTFHGAFATEELAKAHAEQVEGYPDVEPCEVQDTLPVKLDWYVVRAQRWNNGTWGIYVQVNQSWSHMHAKPDSWNEVMQPNPHQAPWIMGDDRQACLAQLMSHIRATEPSAEFVVTDPK